MSKTLEMIKYAKEDNASKFSDEFVSQMNERVATAIASKRENLFKKASD